MDGHVRMRERDLHVDGATSIGSAASVTAGVDEGDVVLELGVGQGCYVRE